MQCWISLHEDLGYVNKRWKSTAFDGRLGFAIREHSLVNKKSHLFESCIRALQTMCQSKLTWSATIDQGVNLNRNLDGSFIF